MHFTSFVTQAALTILLATNVIATPKDLYRCDGRSPTNIKKDEGFKARGYARKFTFSLDLLDWHVRYDTIKLPPMSDPFISTSEDIDAAKVHCFSGYYLYYLDSTKITEHIHDVNKELAGRVTSHEKEKEWAVEKIIPWDAVVKVEKKDKETGKYVRLKLPTRRSLRLNNEEDILDVGAEEYSEF